MKIRQAEKIMLRGSHPFILPGERITNDGPEHVYRPDQWKRAQRREALYDKRVRYPSCRDIDGNDFDYRDDDPTELGEPWCAECNNMGIIECDCGGDLCVCENNGEIECPACH